MRFLKKELKYGLTPKFWKSLTNLCEDDSYNRKKQIIS